MKKIVAAGLLALAPFSASFADNNIGCGWGTQIWQGQEGLFPKILGATTNGTLGNQTFGITSGTSGCSSDGAVTVDARLGEYTGDNLDQIAADMARGEGEALEQLATLYGIQDGDKAHFYQVTKANFATIFSEDATAGDVLARIGQAMAADTRLARYAA